MSIRLLIIFLALGSQLSAWGQTCDAKKKQCDLNCEAAANVARPSHPGGWVKLCELDCYRRQGCAPNVVFPVAPPRPWDPVPALVSLKDQYDPNGFLRNPDWAWATPGGARQDVCDSCSCKKGVWAFSAPDQVQDWLGSANCTNGPIHENSNNLCSGDLPEKNASGVGYHMNWEPVEYEGVLSWDEASDWLGAVGRGGSGDNEYTFNIFRPDLALVTKHREGAGVHVEFNSTETVDEWDDTETWWKHFHKDVDTLDRQAIRAGLGTPFTVVVGMLGLDVAHTDHHAELHPVYAMFIREAHPLAAPTVRWHFFVKNWGSEGYCSHDDEQLWIDHIDVQLPDRKLVSLSSFPYRHGQDHEACENNVEIDSNGVLRFWLSTPDMKCGYFGDLTMINSNSPAVLTEPGTAARVTSQSAFDEDEGVDPLDAKIAKLSPSDRQELRRQLLDAMREPRSQSASRPKTVVKQLSSPFARTPQFKVTNKNVRAVPDADFRAKEAKKRQLTEQFLKARGIQ